jgi:hypothetical protein
MILQKILKNLYVRVPKNIKRKEVSHQIRKAVNLKSEMNKKLLQDCKKRK